jgi:hypothetical protein
MIPLESIFQHCISVMLTILAVESTCNLLDRESITLLDGGGNDRAGQSKSRGEVSEGRHDDDLFTREAKMSEWDRLTTGWKTSCG